MVTTRLKRKVNGSVERVEETPPMKQPKVKKVKKPLTPAARQRKADKAEDHRLTKENDQILRALALMRDKRCVVPDCPHPLDNLQISHIYPKGKNNGAKGGYPWMRWLLPNVEMRCAWHHKFAPGSPHNDAGGFQEWCHYHLPTWRQEYLAMEAMRREQNPKPDTGLEFKLSENARLKEMYLKETGSHWGE